MTRRLLVSYLSLTLLVLLGLEIPFGIIYARAELSRFTDAVERDVVMLTELAEEEIEEGNMAALPRLIGDYARRTGGQVIVVDRTGSVLSDSVLSQSRTNLATAADIGAALRNEQTVATTADPNGMGDILTVTRLQHLLAAQRSFAADASHQLKTPLTALRLRMENLEPDLHPRAHPSLDTALTEIDRLDRMIHGLLALARLEHTATRPQPVDLDSILAERADIWTAFAAEQHVTIAVTGPPVGAVWAVPGALEQILDNLLANALRVAPPASSITLARTIRRTGGHTDGTDIELRVIDQGPGMTATERAHACDRFWRSPTTHGDTSHDGTGLGLAIVAHLVRSSGGDITLLAAPGGGLEVLIRLKSANHSAIKHRIQATKYPVIHQPRPQQRAAR